MPPRSKAGLVASSSVRAAQAPRDRHSGEHRPGALVSEPRERHPLVALSRRRGDGVSGAGAGARLDDRHVGRRLTLVGRRLELSQFSRGEVDGREEARAAAVSEERLPRVAHAGPAGDGDLRPAGRETRQDTEPGVLRRGLRLSEGHGCGGGATTKLSSSQPKDSPCRRTLSRVCSNAWLGPPSTKTLGQERLLVGIERRISRKLLPEPRKGRV
jgi:hypothetical protein